MFPEDASEILARLTLPSVAFVGVHKSVLEWRAEEDDDDYDENHDDEEECDERDSSRMADPRRRCALFPAGGRRSTFLLRSIRCGGSGGLLILVGCGGDGCCGSFLGLTDRLGVPLVLKLTPATVMATMAAAVESSLMVTSPLRSTT